MTYSAPRQGRFAIVLLVSFCLHILFFVLTDERSTTEHNQAFARQVSESLQDELKLPLAIDDRVSGAMILGRYKNDERLSYLGLYNTAGELIVPVGEQSTSETDNNENSALIKTPIVNGSESLGALVVEAKPVSRAAIIGEHWLFLIGVLLVHISIWLTYGYIARPSRKLKEQIAKDTRDKLLAQGVLATTLIKSNEPKLPNIAPIQPKANETETKPVGVNELLSKLTKSDQEPDTVSATFDNRPSSELCVRFEFNDRYELISVLADDVRTTYYAFCDELLQNCLKELLTLPSLAGVKVTAVERFGKTGASVCLAKTSEQARLVNAGALLARLMLTCYQSIYDKHRELRWFILPIKTMVYDKKYDSIARQLSAKYNEPVVVLLDEENLKVLDGAFFVMPLKNKPSPSKLIAFEKACRVITDPSPTTVLMLDKLKMRIFGA